MNQEAKERKTVVDVELRKGERAEIARRAGVSRSHITRWFNCDYPNKPADHLKLLRIMHEVINDRNREEKELTAAIMLAASA